MAPKPKEYLRNLAIYKPTQPVLKLSKLNIEIMPIVNRNIPIISELKRGFILLAFFSSSFVLEFCLANPLHPISFYLFSSYYTIHLHRNKH